MRMVSGFADDRVRSMYICGDCCYMEPNFGGMPAHVKWCSKHKRQTRAANNACNKFTGDKNAKD